MALTWNVSKTAWFKQPENVQTEEWPIVQTFILMCPVLGVDKVTDENVNDIEARLRFYEGTIGAILTSKGKDIKFPVSILKQLVGLYTNVSPQSWKAYSRRIADNFHYSFTH